ncbi:MarR family winged helix-turn-helix transcriptional regulator [Shewanella fidelis]|uniref:MarR family transcriptional regulator n=1 Tax=Shewanella fidelis TaxID=173509 RepID=A0AAW8NM27_9GAMM|nr:MarR family transcriptional regulator [Shewanella fidelis]MDR8523737.1 MarR family transcriptional regulator [Shewanella fidelis]MDW4810285.1 MarR family transcriptional regulator [Shewanella fidelis]MDW4814430.1 MarR family transcriptional regulator [Shewanella fidelis]MDW4818520.1 MarR family transcriptional regulator [Shewanella fidelis]MDW4823827.1 MarR family transcriptional regulator [Shewanella fidelis]
MNKGMEDVLQLNKDNWPECAETSFPALLRLTQVNNIFIQIIKDCVESYGLQSADFNLLTCLRRNPAPHVLSPTELYQSMLFSSGGLTKVLNRLQKMELIERLDNPEDKRSKLVKLSSSGKALVEEIMPVLHKQEKRMVEEITSEELVVLDELMQRITSSMDRDGQRFLRCIRFSATD